MSYEQPTLGALDYAPCRYGKSKLVMRGPAEIPDAPFVACLGSTETYGKFVAEPFPDLLAKLVGTPTLNLGVVNAGVDAFVADTSVHDLVNLSDCAVIQTMGAQNLNNAFYNVHPRRNDRFIAPTEALYDLYPEVDFTEFHFNRALLLRLRQVSRSRFETVVAELKRAWRDRMAQLVAQLECRVVVLWVSDVLPPAPDDLRFRRDPLFVDREMLQGLDGVELVQVDISPAALASNTRGMQFAPLQAPMAAELLGPSAHCEVAVALSAKVAKLIEV